MKSIIVLKMETLCNGYVLYELNLHLISNPSIILTSFLKKFPSRKDLEEFDAMVYEEGKLYERVLLQVVDDQPNDFQKIW